MKEKQKIQLSDSFSYTRLIRFVIPSVTMMIFTSIYSIVDGFFVSNFVNKTAFAAVNLMMPLLIILGAVGFMIGTGGTAIVAKTLGLGEKDDANKYFSFLVYFTVAAGVLLSVLGILFSRPVAVILGAGDGEMLEYCVVYCQIVLLGLPFFMLQNVFQSFFITAERPKLGLLVTVMAGLTNIVLDALLVGVLSLGVAGAAIATALSQFVGGVFPLIYFGRKNTSTLRLGKTKFYGRVLLHTVTNGSSELMSNISSSVVTIFYNMQLMRFAGEDGVAAYGAIMYVSFIFCAVFIGFTIGSSPIVSFHFGAGNRAELRSLRKKSVNIIAVTSLVMTALSILLSGPLSELFVGYDRALYDITHRGFIIFSFVFLTMGINIFGSGFFTALNNGIISAVIAFLRTLVFQIAAVLILPEFFELDGVWFSIIVADVLSLIVTVSFLVAKRKKYGY